VPSAAPAAVTSAPAGIAAPADKRTYYRLFSAQLLALLSTGVATVGLGLLAFRLFGEDAGAVLGTALSLKMLAYVVVAPIAAGITGRLPRRAVLIAMDLVRAAAILALPFVDAVWQVLALIFLHQGASAVFTATYQATVPDLLPADADYTKALSRSRLGYELEGVVSPALAALFITTFGLQGLFIAAMTGFLLSTALLLRIRLPTARPSDLDLAARTTRGLGLFWRTRRLRGLLALELAVALGMAMAIVNTVVIVQGEWAMGETEVAAALAIFGAGSVAAAITLPRLLRSTAPRRLMIAGAALVAASLALGALIHAYPTLLLLWLLMGVGVTLVQTPAGAVLRHASAREDRPWLYAAQLALAHGCLGLGFAFAGWSGAAIGLGPAFLLAALAAAFATWRATRLWPGEPGQRLTLAADAPTARAEP
jgi:predicted MFS family arabinose efflux permease